MLTFEQITELVNLVAERNLEGLEVERSGFRLKIDGQRPGPTVVAPAAPAPAAVAPPAPAAAPAAAPPAAAAAKAPEEAESDLPEGAHIVTSPIVGTFYSASSPDADPFVKVGDRISKGQVLCIVEAMKLMNEIEADVAGVVQKVLPKNAQPVEYGEPLFAIKAD